MVRMKWDCRLSTGLPPSSRLRQLWSRKGDLQRAWNRDRKAVWDQVGLSHCRHEGLVMVRDKARLRRGRDDQSRRGHQCSETTLTGESRFHITTPLGIWTWVPCDGKQTGYSTGPVRHGENEVRLQGLHNICNLWIEYYYKVLLRGLFLCVYTEEKSTFIERNRFFAYVSTTHM